jgi:hypothetical protein
MKLKELFLTIYVFLENVATLFTVQWIVYHEACHVLAAKWIGAKINKITWVKFATKDDLAHGRVIVGIDEDKATRSDRFVLAFAPQIIGLFVISLMYLASYFTGNWWIFRFSWLVIPGMMISPSDVKIFVNSFKKSTTS